MITGGERRAKECVVRRIRSVFVVATIDSGDDDNRRPRYSE
jgi:hypothetical protein